MTNNTSYDGYNVCAPDCGCNDTGNVTSTELQQACAFLWMVVCRDCKETPVRVTPTRFAKYVAELVEVDYVLIQKMVDEQFAALDFSTFVTTTQLADAINAIVFPDTGVTMSEVNQAIADALASALGGYVTTAYLTSNYTTTADLNTLLNNYYTKQQTNDLISGLQGQITTLNVAITDLQTQIDACCNTTSLTPPTADWPNALTGVCPATVSAVVANPDGQLLTFTVASGGATIGVTANGVVVPLSNATIADGDTVEVTISHPSANVVGGINVTYEDANGNTQLVDGFQYDVQCAVTTPTNTAPTSNGSVAGTATPEGTATTLDMSLCFSDADNDTLTYALVAPATLPSGITFSTTTGLISLDATVAVGTYVFSVTANDGQATSPACTATIEVQTVIVPIVAGWSTAQITQVIDAGNADNETSSSGNSAVARVFLGDIATAAPSVGTYPAAFANSGVIDDVTTTGTEPLEPTLQHGVAFGDSYATIPLSIPDLVNMRISAVGTPDVLDEQDAANNGTVGAYALGSWVPVAAGNYIIIRYNFPEADAVLGEPNIKTGQFVYEFEYSDGQLISQQFTLTATNTPSATGGGGGPLN